LYKESCLGFFLNFKKIPQMIIENLTISLGEKI